MKIGTLENEVKEILKHNTTARADDMALYANYVFNHIEDEGLGNGWLIKIFSDRRYRVSHGISGYESVSRCRRKLQERYEELRPDEETIKIRKREEKRWKAYAKSGKNTLTKFVDNLSDEEKKKLLEHIEGARE